MKFLVFHPEWGVPDSIKLKEIAPYLSGGGGFFFFGNDTSILTRQRMRVVYNGRPVDPSSVNWGSVDVRRFSFIQSPGPHNVLGVVKFMFPNKHDIYMHDTPQRELFEQQVRLFSHGCIRVHNPGRLAELLLAEDKGWPAEQVRGLLAQGNNNEVQLQRQIPVHVSYFTAVAGEDGHVNYFSDVYGHDNRVLAALGGRPLPADLGPGGEASTGRRRASLSASTSRRATTSSPGCSATEQRTRGRCRVAAAAPPPSAGSALCSPACLPCSPLQSLRQRTTCACLRPVRYRALFSDSSLR